MFKAGMTEERLAELNGLDRIWDAGRSVWELPIRSLPGQCHLPQHVAKTLARQVNAHEILGVGTRMGSFRNPR